MACGQGSSKAHEYAAGKVGALWRSRVIAKMLRAIQSEYSIPDSKVLRAPESDKGEIILEETNEMCIYKEMLKASIRFHFPNHVLELLSVISIAP